MQSRIYYVSVTIWFAIIFSYCLAALFMGLPAPVFVRYYAVFNSLGALAYIFIYRAQQSAHIDLNENVTRKDLTFVLLTIFGPFGILPVLYINIAINDKSGEKFEDFLKYVEFSDAKYDDYSLMDVTGEFKKQLYKEAVIDAIKYGDSFKKRNAIELLSKMRTMPAVNALKKMSHDSDYEIRFSAVNKLSALEDEFVREIDWYKTAISVCGPVPELLFQYGATILKFSQTGLLYDELAQFHLNNSAAAFRALLGNGAFKTAAIIGLARSLRYSKKYGEARELLEKNISCLDGEGIDELAQCYFLLKEYGALDELINRSARNEVKAGRLLSNFMKNDESEGKESGDIYSVRSSEECSGLFDRCNTLDFNETFSKIKNITNSYILANIFGEVSLKSRNAMVLFLKVIKGKADSELIWSIKKMLYCDDRLLNIMSADVLAASEFPLRTEIFIDLLSHDSLEIKLVAVRFLGLKRVEHATARLVKLLKIGRFETELKKEALWALSRIGDGEALGGLRYALREGGGVLAKHAIGLVKMEKLKGLAPDLYSFLRSDDMELVKVSASALLSFNETEINGKIIDYYKNAENKIKSIIEEEATGCGNDLFSATLKTAGRGGKMNGET